MDLSALAKAIATDESWLDFLTPFLIGASAAVVVALIIEQWPDFGKLHWHHWDNDKFLEILGGTCVAIFITSELLITFLASRAETRLRADNSAYETALQGAAAEANKSAAEANKRAAALEKEAADEKRRAADIMKATAWRGFTDQELLILKADLSRHSGRIFLGWIVNDTESLFLAAQFSNFLEQMSNWNVAPYGQTFPTSIVWGIRIPEAPTAEDTAILLRRAFTDADIQFETTDLPKERAMGWVPSDQKELLNRAVIFFGSKRPHFTQPPF